MKNYKNIIIAGAIAVGLYLFLHTKKIIPMTLQQKAAWHEKVSHIMAQMDTAEKIRVLKAARKEKAAAEGTSEQKTKLSPMEMMLAIRAAAEEKEKAAEEEQGTGFDYIRERAPFNIAVPVEKTEYTSTPAPKKKAADERTAWTEKHSSPYKYVDVEENNFSRKDNSSNYSQIPEEEIGVSKKINDKKKADDKKKAEEKKKANEAWDKIVNDVRGPFLKPIYTVSPSKTKKKTTYNKSKIIKALTKKNKR